MTSVASAAVTNLLEAISAGIDTASRAPEGVAEPIAILWTDPDRQWLPLASILRPVLPNFFTLGEWNPAARTGPTIWMKCIVDRTVEEAPPEGSIPVLYLPGVGRQTLRLGVECPTELQPLIELQYRGTVWHQKNGRDWTVEAFLVSELGLDIAQDMLTRESMLRALPLLADADLAKLRCRRLDADDFDLLAVNDPVRELLRWMADPDVFRAGIESSQWESFRSLALKEFDLDPDNDDGLGAAERLLEGKGRWDETWRRFSEAPQLYRRIASRLRQTPKSLLYADRDPRQNEKMEGELRKALEKALDRPHEELRQRILELEQQHRGRRDSVWAKLDEATLAMALEPLDRLAALSGSALGGTSVESIANEYASRGWSCDRALLDALALQTNASDGDLIAKVARALYEPWANKSARNFQKLAGLEPGMDEVRDGPVEQKSCFLFVDGLRFDLAMMLQERLETRGMKVSITHRIAPLPSVTATGKPVASPRRDVFRAGEDASMFNPVIASSGQPVIASRFRDELSRVGVTVISSEETAGPDDEEAVAWSETAEIDKLGHSLQAGLAKQVNIQLHRVVDRVSALIEAGWRVKVVTDHGFLLLPGGLPKVELPKYLVESKWARCAAVPEGATPEMTTYPWYWNQHVRIASPPGIGSYYASCEYAHGGVSPQECVIPELRVEGAVSALSAKITKIEWRGLRCRVSVDTNDPGATLELRYHWNKRETDSPIANPKEIDSAGDASLVVPDDRKEGDAAVVVVIGSNSDVLDYQATTIGEQR